MYVMYVYYLFLRISYIITWILDTEAVKGHLGHFHG